MTDRTGVRQWVQGLALEERKQVIAALKQRVVSRAAPKLHALDDEPLRPTPAQAAMWLHDTVHPESTSYNVNVFYATSESLDAHALSQAACALAQRHDALRLVFQTLSSGVPGVRVSAVMPGFEQIHVDRQEAPDQVLAAFCDRAARRFDLATGPLFRVCLGEAGGTSYLLLSFHHTVCDGGSIPIVLAELGVLYRAFLEGTQAILPSPVAQFSEYIGWQRRWLATEDAARHSEYWKRQLAGAVPGELQPLRRRPPAQSFRGERLKIDFGDQWVLAVRQFAMENSTTPFAVQAALLVLLLGRHGATNDVTIGVPFECRGDPKWERSVGSFINPLPLRVRFNDTMSFGELLAAAHEVVVAALAHQELPFDKILEQVKAPRDPSRNPLFQVLLNPFSVPERISEFEGMTSMPLGSTTIGSKFDLSIYVGTSGALTAIFSTDLYDASYISTFLRRYVEMAQEVIACPEKSVSTYLQPKATLTPYGTDQRQCAYDDWGDCVTSRFLFVAERYAERPAIRSGEHVTTYADLRGLAFATAHLLRALGAAPGQPIAICSDNGAPAVAAQLGVLLCGCHFVPLDPSNPVARLADIVRASAANILLHTVDTVELAASLATTVSVHTAPIPDVPMKALTSGAGNAEQHARSLAYVLFTSGTTGMPKGVMQSQRNLLAHIRAYAVSIEATHEDRLTQFSWFGFDGALMDVYASVLSGACLLTFNLRKEGIQEILARLEGEQATIFHSTPTVFRHSVKHLPDDCKLRHVRAVVLGGEEAMRDDWELFCRHFLPGATFINGYGPSESTTAMQHRLSHESVVPNGRLAIGKPVPGTAVQILNERDEPVGLMATGEIVIVSERLALGYLGDPSATARAFAPHEREPHVRRYRSGDLGRYIDDGTIEFVGRRDGQVKIRGIRVELGEIRAALLDDPAVTACAVVLRHTAQGNRARLIAYYTASRPLDADALKARLRVRLPEYMIPERFVAMSEMPLRRNGKLDESRLPEVVEDAVALSAEPVAGRPVERKVAAIWREVLRAESAPLDVNFFDLGGNSLQLVDVHARLRAAGYMVALVDMFQFPTVRSISERIAGLPAVETHFHS